jgi:hypothetical protein
MTGSHEPFSYTSQHTFRMIVGSHIHVGRTREAVGSWVVGTDGICVRASLDYESSVLKTAHCRAEHVVLSVAHSTSGNSATVYNVSILGHRTHG